MRSSCPSTSSPQKLAVAATADKPGAPRPHRGKTSTAAELLSLLPSSRVFNPETVGHTLQPNLAGQAVSDFQHWPPWRPLVVATATEVDTARRTPAQIAHQVANALPEDMRTV